MNRIFAYLLPIVAGVLNAIHSGTNAELNTTLARPWWAAVAVCAISGFAVLAGAVVAREPLPSLEGFFLTPWWAWVGAAIAAVSIVTSIVYAEKLGGAVYNGLVVTATILFSIVLDHFGLLGFDVHKVTAARLLGSVLMVLGLILIARF